MHSPSHPPFPTTLHEECTTMIYWATSTTQVGHTCLWHPHPHDTNGNLAETMKNSLTASDQGTMLCTIAGKPAHHSIQSSSGKLRLSHMRQFQSRHGQLPRLPSFPRAIWTTLRKCCPRWIECTRISCWRSLTKTSSLALVPCSESKVTKKSLIPYAKVYKVWTQSRW